MIFLSKKKKKKSNDFFFLYITQKKLEDFFSPIYNPNKSMSSYIPNSKLMKNEGVLEKNEKKNEKEIEYVFGRKKETFTKES